MYQTYSAIFPLFLSLQFPETYIGDSEDLFKKIPTGKKHLLPKRDLKSASPPSIDNESQDSDNFTDSAELKEVG